MRPLRAALSLGALLALLALAGSTQGAPPLAQPWQADLRGSPAGAGDALALDMDAGGTQLLIGTSDAGSTGEDNDLVRVLFAQGNVSAEDDAGDLGGVEGKGAVAVSADGRFAIAGGNYSGTALFPGGANIFYYSLPDLTATWSKTKGEPVSTVNINQDGTIVAVGTRNTTASSGRIYRFDAQGNQVWEKSVNGCAAPGVGGGNVLSMDLSRDGRWLVVGTSFTANEGPRGCVFLFNTASFNPLLAYTVPLSTGGELTSVDMSANGQWFAAGTASGAFYVWQNPQGSAPAAPLEGQLNAASAVRALRVSEDGSGLVAADAGSVNRFARGQGVLILEWSAPVSGLRSLDLSPDGEYIVVGASQLTAFHRTGNRTLWTVDLATPLVRVVQPGPNDVRIAAASGGQARGYRLHWALDAHKGEPEPVALSLGQARSVQVELRNTGSAVDTFDLSASGQGFTVALDPPRVLLRPGEALNTTLTLTPNPNAEARLYRVDIVARGARSGVEIAIPLNVTIAAVPRLGLGLADQSYLDRGVYQGEEHQVTFEVRNSGNSRLEVAYDLVQQPNLGSPWEASLSRTSGNVEAGGVTTNTLTVLVPFEARNGTENVFNVTARGEGAQASTSFRLVVNPQFTAAIEVIPLSKVVAPGRSVTYNVVVANNGTLRETYRLVYCVALPDTIPCIGNATTGLGGWSVALDTSAFPLGPGTSRSFHLAVGAPRGAIANVDKLVLQVEVVSANLDHRLRDTKLVLTSVQEAAAPTPPAPTPGFEAAAAIAALGAAVLARRKR